MKTFYDIMLNQIRQHHLENIVIVIAKHSPYIIAMLYLLTLSYLFINQHSLLFVTIFKPLSTFLLVTVLRKFINRPRPCVQFHIQPLVAHKKDQSFPSRHTASAFAIALALANLHTTLGIIAILLACIVALSRLLTGVHFISDIFAGIIISFLIFII